MELSGLARALLPGEDGGENWFACYAEQFETVALPFCVHDMPGSVSPRIGIGTTAYVRFHETKGKYRGGYSRAKLEAWAEWMKAQDREGRIVWAYFNNDYDAQAIIDARILKEAAGV